MEAMLSDGKVMEKLAKLKAQDSTLWEKLKEGITWLADKIRELYASLKPDSKEGKYVAQMRDSIEQLQQLFTEGLQEASANYQAANGQKNTAQQDGSKNGSGLTYSFRDSKSGMANDALLPYSEELSDLIQQRGDYIINNFAALTEIVNLAFSDTNKKATAYFGIINTETLNKIQNSIPNLPNTADGVLFKDGQSYSVAVTMDSIRHLVDEKGLSKEDVIDYLDRFADTVIDFDSVSFGYYERGNSRTSGLLFKKAFNDGVLLSFDLVSHKKRRILLQSLYMDNADYQKKKSSKTLLMQNAHSNTPKAQVGKTSNETVTQSNENVKKFSIRDPELQKANAVLEKENAKLREDVQELKALLKLQRTVTGGTKFTKTSLEAAARYLKSTMNSKGDTREFAAILQDFYEYIATDGEITWESVADMAQPAIQWLQEHTKQSRNDYAQDVLKHLRGSRISLDEQQKQEAAETKQNHYFVGRFGPYALVG